MSALERQNALAIAYRTALQADRDWQSYLDVQQIDRYSPLSSDHGYCRELYLRKCAADRELHNAFAAIRAEG